MFFLAVIRSLCSVNTHGTKIVSIMSKTPDLSARYDLHMTYLLFYICSEALATHPAVTAPCEVTSGSRSTVAEIMIKGKVSGDKNSRTIGQLSSPPIRVVSRCPGTRHCHATTSSFKFHVFSPRQFVTTHSHSTANKGDLSRTFRLAARVRRWPTSPCSLRHCTD